VVFDCDKLVDAKLSSVRTMGTNFFMIGLD